MIPADRHGQTVKNLFYACGISAVFAGLADFAVLKLFLLFNE
jgi:hypothetical protein